MIVVPFLALALLVSASIGHLGEDDQEPNVIVTYDISAIAFDHQEDTDAYMRSLVPYAAFERFDASDYGVSDERGSADLVAELVRELFEEEFNYEGRSLDVTQDGRFLVRGPAALHDRIGPVLAFLEDNANAETALLVDVFRFDIGTDLEGPAVRSAADAWIETVAASATAHHSYRLPVHVDRTSVLDLSRKVSAVLDYDVEIAQSAAVADPIVGMASIGTWLAVRGAPRGGGLELALTLKRGDELKSDPVRDLDMRSQITGENKQISFVESASEITPLAILNRSLAFNTYIGADQALVLRTRVDLGRGKAHELVVLRSGGGTLAELRRLELDGSGRTLFIADLGALAPPVSTARGWLLKEGPMYGSLDREGLVDPVLLRAGQQAGDSDPRVELLSEITQGMNFNPIGRWLFAYPQGDLESTDIRPVQDGFVANFESLRASGATHQLTVELTRGDKSPVALARVPIRMGESCAIALGVEDLVVPDYFVEVAQGATTVDPLVAMRFDGLVLWLRPTFGTSGNLSLDVRGGAQLLTGSKLFGDRNPMFGGLDLSRFVQLFVHDRLEMQPAFGGYELSLGDLADTKGPDALRLDIRIER